MLTHFQISSETQVGTRCILKYGERETKCCSRNLEMCVEWLIGGGISQKLTVTVVIVGLFLLQTPNTYAQTQAVVATPQSQGSAVVDIIVEGETYVPYFYAGRAEPSPGNSTRLVAIVTGAERQPANYNWKIGGQYFTTSEPVLRTTIPMVEQNVLAEVSVSDESGVAIGKGSEYVTTTAPTLLFYEDNALRGTSRTTIREEFILIGEEAAIKVEPYFAGADSPTALRATWSSNLPTEVSNEDWRLLYIQSPEGDAASGQVQLRVNNPRNLNEYMSETFNVSL